MWILRFSSRDKLFCPLWLFLSAFRTIVKSTRDVCFLYSRAVGPRSFVFQDMLHRSISFSKTGIMVDARHFILFRVHNVLVVSITITSTPSLSGPPLVCLTPVLSPDIRILAAAPRSFWEITLQTFLKQLCSVLRCRTHSFRVRFQTFMHILVFGSYVVSKVCFKLQKPITVTHLDLLNTRKYVVCPVCYTQLLST